MALLPDKTFAHNFCVPLLRDAQNEDGGWGFHAGAESRAEATCWAIKALSTREPENKDNVERGLKFLSAGATCGWVVAIHFSGENRLLGYVAGLLGSGGYRRWKVCEGDWRRLAMGMRRLATRQQLVAENAAEIVIGEAPFKTR